MQIKTALAIGAGVTIGVIFGMGVSEDTKCRLFGKIRKKLIYALGGEEKKTYAAFKGPKHYTTYADYNKKYNEKEQAKRRVDIPDRKLLEFESRDSANRCLGEIEEHIKTFGYLSVHELACMREIALDYTWDSYGWRKEDLYQIDSDPIFRDDASGLFLLNMPRPTILK